MAERRMFAKTIVLSDAFLDMPMSARCLYFTLGMLADDDGFVNSPKSIMRQCGAQEDDIRILLAKKYLLDFEDGVIVIKHWRVNNYLQKDRINPTAYFEHKNTLELDKKGAYTRKDDNVYTEADSVYTQYSIGKDSIDKVSIGKDCSDFTLENVKKYVEERGNKIDPEKFYNYYGDGVEDWKAKVEEWERTQFKRPTNQSTNQKDKYATYDTEAFESYLNGKD